MIGECTLYWQAGVRSFIITFDVYVILNVLRNMIIKDLTPYVNRKLK